MQVIPFPESAHEGDELLKKAREYLVALVKQAEIQSS